MEAVMTDEYFVEQLCRKMGEKEPYGIEWYENPEGGLMAEINGATLKIGGAQDSPIFLEISFKGKRCVFKEPAVPQSFVRNVLNWLGRNSNKDRANDLLRKNLESLLDKAVKQCLSRYQNSDYQERVKQEFFEQIFGRL
jgi:hypothetical protein